MSTWKTCDIVFFFFDFVQMLRSVRNNCITGKTSENKSTHNKYAVNGKMRKPQNLAKAGTRKIKNVQVKLCSSKLKA